MEEKVNIAEILKDKPQGTKLYVHPNRETYYLFIDNWSQDVVRIHIDDLLSGDYYVGKYDRIFVMEKRKNFFRRMIKNCDKRIEELKSK